MIENGRIKSTMLGVEDHGMMTFFLMVEWQGAGCGVGGYSLDSHGRELKARVGNGHAYQAIRHILETLKVSRWEDLPGTYIRIDHGGLGSGVKRIGHIVEDRWFDLAEHMKGAGDG